MIIFRFILPFLFFIFVSSAFGILTNKTLLISCAPSFFIQIIIILFSSMLFNSFTSGIVIGGLLAISIIIYKALTNTTELVNYFRSQRNQWSIFVFVCFYLFIYLSNYGKTFQDWDEFSH